MTFEERAKKTYVIDVSEWFANGGITDQKRYVIHGGIGLHRDPRWATRKLSEARRYKTRAGGERYLKDHAVEGKVVTEWDAIQAELEAERGQKANGTRV